MLGCGPASRSALRGPDRRACHGRRRTRGHRQRDRVLSTDPGALRGGTPRTFSGGRARGRPRGDDVHRTASARPPRALELSATAVIPRSGGSYSAHESSRTSACSCEACAPGARARVVRLGDQTSLHTGNIYGSGKDAFEQAYDMFRVAEGLLAEAGMSFRDVVRTWIHLRDIDRDYAALNRARRDFFGRCGIERRPASTCVQGIPFPGTHDFSMSLHATSVSRGRSTSRRFTPRCSTKRGPTVRTSRAA